MYLKSLRLENIACFEELDLDFTDENGEPCKWVVLLGENGTGKSSLLWEGIAQTIGMTHWGLNTRNGKDEGRCTASALITAGDDLYSDKNYLSVTAYTKGGSNQWELLEGNKDIVKYINRENKGFFCRGYGSNRRLTRGESKSDQFPSYLQNFLSLAGWDDSLVSIHTWLPDLDYQKMKLAKILEGNSTEEIKNQYNRVEVEFDKIIAALNKILPEGVNFLNITSDKQIMFNDNGVNIPVNKLSDGYKTVISWVGDLIYHLIKSFPGITDPLLASGIVMVDELDLHLHPRWQRTIVQKIRNIFPNLQFIVTSHSPFIAQDMTEKDKIIVLTRDGDKVTARQEKGFVKGWRADQILTSWLFGLETTRDEEIESLEKERRVGLQRDEENLLTDEERKDLDRVTNELEAMRSSDVAPDRQKLDAAAALVMELMGKTL